MTPSTTSIRRRMPRRRASPSPLGPLTLAATDARPGRRCGSTASATTPARSTRRDDAAAALARAGRATSSTTTSHGARRSALRRAARPAAARRSSARVWQALLGIAPGRTSQLRRDRARASARRRAVRAVGAAVGRNPVSVDRAVPPRARPRRLADRLRRRAASASARCWRSRARALAGRMSTASARTREAARLPSSWSRWPRSGARRSCSCASARPSSAPVALAGVRVAGAALFLLPLLRARGQLARAAQALEADRCSSASSTRRCRSCCFGFAALAHHRRAVVDLQRDDAAVRRAGRVAVAAATGSTPSRVARAGDRLRRRARAGLGQGQPAAPMAPASAPRWPIVACLAARCCTASRPASRASTSARRAADGGGRRQPARRGAGVLAPIAVAAWPATMPGAAAWLPRSLLAVLCTGVAYVLYFRLIANVGPTNAISVTFLIPAFGVLWGLVAARRGGRRFDAGRLRGDPCRAPRSSPAWSRCRRAGLSSTQPPGDAHDVQGDPADPRRRRRRTRR